MKIICTPLIEPVTTAHDPMPPARFPRRLGDSMPHRKDALYATCVSNARDQPRTMLKTPRHDAPWRLHEACLVAIALGLLVLWVVGRPL